MAPALGFASYLANEIDHFRRTGRLVEDFPMSAVCLHLLSEIVNLALGCVIGKNGHDGVTPGGNLRDGREVVEACNYY